MRKLPLILSLLLLCTVCFSQSRYISSTTKKIVYSRDGGICQCCGGSELLEYDHIIPFSCGGESEATNIQLLCRKCNRSKSNSCYCKVHNRKVGNDCCDGSTLRGKSPSHTKKVTHSGSGIATQCTGTTQKGTRCKNRTTNSSRRCHLHD